MGDRRVLNDYTNHSDEIRERIYKLREEEFLSFKEIAERLNNEEDLNEFQYSAFNEEECRREYMIYKNTKNYME